MAYNRITIRIQVIGYELFIRIYKHEYS